MSESGVIPAAKFLLRFCYSCRTTSETRIKYDCTRAGAYFAATGMLIAAHGRPRRSKSPVVFHAGKHDWHHVMKMSEIDFEQHCASIVEVEELVEHLIRRGIHMLQDGNQLLFTAPTHTRIVPPVEEPLIPENFKFASPKKTPKPGASPVKPQQALTDLPDGIGLNDHSRFDIDQEMVPHKWSNASF